MRRNLVATIVIALSTPIMAEEIRYPRAGSCTVENMGGTTVYDWIGSEAKIKIDSDLLNIHDVVLGEVVGMRPYLTAFRLSVIYNDPISGPTEAAIFKHMDVSTGSDKFRLATINYEDLEDGRRVVMGVLGYEDVSCTVIW